MWNSFCWRPAMHALCLSGPWRMPLDMPFPPEHFCHLEQDGWVRQSLCSCVCVCLCAQPLQLRPTLWDPVDCIPPGYSSWGFSGQEYWRGLPCPPPGALAHPGIKHASLLSPELAGGLFSSATWEAPCGCMVKANLDRRRFGSWLSPALLASIRRGGPISSIGGAVWLKTLPLTQGTWRLCQDLKFFQIPLWLKVKSSVGQCCYLWCFVFLKGSYP